MTLTILGIISALLAAIPIAWSWWKSVRKTPAAKAQDAETEAHKESQDFKDTGRPS